MNQLTSSSPLYHSARMMLFVSLIFVLFISCDDYSAFKTQTKNIEKKQRSYSSHLNLASFQNGLLSIELTINNHGVRPLVFQDTVISAHSFGATTMITSSNDTIEFIERIPKNYLEIDDSYFILKPDNDTTISFVQELIPHITGKHSYYYFRNKTAYLDSILQKSDSVWFKIEYHPYMDSGLKKYITNFDLADSAFSLTSGWVRTKTEH